MRAFPLALALLALAAPLAARPEVAIDSAIYVERDEPSSQGPRRVVEPADLLHKGDRVVTVLRWEAPNGSFTVTSPIPRTLAFERSSADAIEISTDGGRSWRTFDGSIQPGSVTDLRWRVGSGAGQLTYSAHVR